VYRRLTSLCGFLLAGASAFAAPPKDLDAYVSRALASFEVPGMAVTIVEEQDTTFAKGYGLRKLGERQRVDAHTLFHIGSLTKAFTAAALAILVDEGKLSWDDRVADRLPGFRMYDAYTTHEMTLRDLLVHRSGLGLGAGDLLMYPPTTFTPAEIVARLRFIPPATSFRSGYAYDNVLYVVAGEVIERVSGSSWRDFVEERIFKPLGMLDSTASFQPRETTNHAWPHSRLEGPIRGLGTVVPLAPDTGMDNGGAAGAINASAVDMARWLRVLLNRGASGGKAGHLFSEEAAREMWTPQTLIPSEPVAAGLAATAPNFHAYALGWEVRDYGGHKILTHSGAVDGMRAVNVVIPDERVAFAVMINSDDGGARWAVFYHLLDHYLRKRPTDWIAAYKQARQQALAKALQTLQSAPAVVPGGPGPSLPLPAYAGVYRDAWYGTIHIQTDGAGLRIRFDHTPSMDGTLEHVRYDTFRTRWTDRLVEDAYVSFALRPDGSIDQMKMQAVSPLADFSFDYQDLLFKRVESQ
jgi:CubicO group peptidase (beta-lactamase class C family)